MKSAPFDISTSPSIDQVGLQERVARFKTRSIKKEAKVSALKLALSMVDLTTLESKDTPGKVRQLCAKAVMPDARYPDFPHVGAVCVYPPMVGVARRALRGSGVHLASVATAFPSGMAPLAARLEEIRQAVADGADEIDMVISRGQFLAAEYNAVFDEIARSKEACGKAHLKVIFETGELLTFDNVRRASDLAMEAGADFIKTSTGKVQPAATLEASLVMLQAIQDYYHRTGRRVGMKPAGGIKDAKTALTYLVMVKETLGPEWLTPDLFRFGASSLGNDLLMQLVKELTGHYQSLNYYSLD